MARTKPQEIIRRVGIPSRQSERPDLVVAADLDASRGHGALSRIAVDTLNRVSGAFTEVAIARKQKRDEEDAAKGESQRTQEDLEGKPRMADDQLAEMSEAFRRGYLKADGALRIRDWQLETMKELAKAEPGEDIEPILRAKLAELMASPEFQDPKVKAALMPAASRAADAVRAHWQEQSLKETFLRQEESLTALARAGIKDKSLLTVEGMEKFYANLNSEEFAYLSRRDVDAIIARAVIDVLQSGDVDPDEVLNFLAQPRKDGTPGLLHNKAWADQLQNAAQAGRNVIAKRREEAQAQAMADAEFHLQDLANRGQMTDGVITKYADAFGLEGKERLSFIRYWSNQQEQTLRRWEAERKAAERHAQTMRALASGNPYQVGMSKAKKAAAREWDNTPQEKRGQVILKYARMGVPIPQVEAVFDNMTSATLPFAAKLYRHLRQVDPLYAAKYVNDGTAGLLWQHNENVTRFGMTEEDSLKSLNLGVPAAKRGEVRPLVAKALTDYIKRVPKLPEGVARPPEFVRMVQQLAEADMAANPGITAQAAVRAAEERVRTRYTLVGGRYVPRGEAMPGAERAIDAVVGAARKKMVAAGRITPAEATGIGAMPNPHDQRQWVLTINGRPMKDPDTGKPATFFPNDVAALYHQWETERDVNRIRGNQVWKQITRGRHAPERDYQEALRTLPGRIAEKRKQIANQLPGLGRSPGLERELAAMEGRLKALQDAGVRDIPDDFMEYLRQTQTPNTPKTYKPGDYLSKPLPDYTRTK